MSAKITKRERRGKIVYTTVVNLPPEPETGKRRQKRISARTKAEVETELARVLVSMSDGGYAEADAKKLLVKDYIDWWLRHVAATLRPASQGRYEEVVRLHIVPELGKLQLAKLTPLQVQTFYGKLLASC